MKLPLPIEEPRRGIGWPRLIARLLLAAVVIWTLIEYGPALRDELAILDSWIESAGPLAPLVFVALAGILIPLFFPVTAMKVSAGAIFGPWLGTLVCVASQFTAAVIIYQIGRRFLTDRVERFALDEPRLRVVREAAERGTAGRQFMVRMTPLSFTLVSYVLAALGVRLKPYLIGCLSAVPSTIVTVGFAHAARRATELGTPPEDEGQLSTVAVIALAFVALVAFGWFARRADAKLFESTEA